MPVLTAQDLQKSFGPQTVLDHVTLTIRTGERVGLVGLNGSGKSTLSRILAGREAPDAGTVARRRGAQVLYLEQDPRFEGEITARGAVMAGLTAWSEAKGRHDRASESLETGEGDIDALLAAQESAAADVERLGGWDRSHEIDSLIGHLGIPRPDDPVRTLSGGERRRVALAQILVARPHLAVLDEPTNHLDVETIEWLERYLIDEYEGALLLITHDRYLLDRVAQRTLELDRGKVYSYDGGYEEYLAAKADRLAHMARTESNRQNFLRRELEWLARQPKARSTKQKARIERAEDAKAQIAPRAEKTARFSVEETRTGKTILELSGLGLDEGGKRLIESLNFMLTKGERVGIIGRNGTGKTTLLRAVMGEKAPARGTLTVGQNARVAYFDQERVGLDPALSIYDNVAGDQPKIEVGGVAIEPRSYLERFNFDPQKQRQPVSSLSGGERARVALAKLLRQSANLLLLDEPTNDLDVATLGALEEMLIEFDGTALVVTHDRWFLDRVATSILAFEGDGRVVRYPGNYETYRRLKAQNEADARQKEPLPAPRSRPPSDPKPARRAPLSAAESRELGGILDAIEAAEKKAAALEAALADPALYAGGGEIKEKVAALAEARAQAARLTARWEDLEKKRGGGG